MDREFERPDCHICGFITSARRRMERVLDAVDDNTYSTIPYTQMGVEGGTDAEKHITGLRVPIEPIPLIDIPI